MPEEKLNYVGFDSITDQYKRKFLKRGFELNVMVVGLSGLGKSTLANTLFSTHVLDSKASKASDEAPRITTEIQTIKHVRDENGVRMNLTVIDTPGFGDQINSENAYVPIVKYIKEQYASYLKQELSPRREKRIPDTRVHVVLYFISPSGHSLKSLDILAMQKIAETTNLVPVIAKSDSLTLEERAAFKDRILEEIRLYEIPVYPFDSPDDDDADIALNQAVRSLIPFAVVGSEKVHTVNGKTVRGRKTRGGIVNVDDEAHCDFVHLRNFLMRSHLQDLIDQTHFKHYETFRTKQLEALKRAEDSTK